MGIAEAGERPSTQDWRGLAQSYLESMDGEQLENLVAELWRLEGFDNVERVEGKALDLVATKHTPVPVRSVVRVVDRATTVETRETARVAEEFGNVNDTVLITRRPADDCVDEANARGVDLLDIQALADFVVGRRYHWPLFRWILRSTRSGYRTAGEVSEAPVDYGDVGEGRALVGRDLAEDLGIRDGDVLELLDCGGTPVSVERRGLLSLKREGVTLDRRYNGDVGDDGTVRFDRVDAEVANRIQVVCTHEILETQKLSGFFEGEVVYRSLERSIDLNGGERDARAMVVDVDPGTICTVGEETTFHQVSFRQLKNRLS